MTTSKKDGMSPRRRAFEKCPKKLCTTLEYSGEESYYNKLIDKNITVGFEYEIPSNLVILYEEYWIYDVISMISSVGGTLGLCIGFSFTGMISFLSSLIQNGIVFIKAKLACQNISNFKYKNGSSNRTTEIKVSQRGEAFNSRIYKHNEY